jgi:hypothetical protein
LSTKFENKEIKKFKTEKEKPKQYANDDADDDVKIAQTIGL